MVRTVLTLFVVALIGVTAGCTMCAHPYDYCGALYTGKCGPMVCGPTARAGSVLSPPLYPMSGGEMVPDSETGPNTMQPIPDPLVGQMPGVEQQVDMGRAVQSYGRTARAPQSMGYRMARRPQYMQ